MNQTIVLIGRQCGLVNAEDTVLIIQRQGHITLQVAAIEVDCRCNGLVLVASHLQIILVGFQSGTCERGLDTDYHLLVLVITVKCIESIVVIACTAPTEVDVVFVGISVIAIDVEGVTTTEPTTRNSAEDDGTFLNKFLLNQGSPFGIGVKRDTPTIGTGFFDHAHGFLVITEQLEGIDNQFNTVGVDTASIHTIGHVLGLSHITHERCHSIALSRAIAAGIGIQHIVPIKGYRRQSGNIHHCGTTPRGSGEFATIGGYFGSGIVGIFPVMEYHSC